MGVLPRGMWLLFRGNFERKLALLGVDAPEDLMARAKGKYREIIESVEPFGKEDAFEINIVSAAVCLSLPERPKAGAVERYYAAAMDSRATRLFLKRSDYYTAKYQNRLARSAEASRRSVNPYSWRFAFVPGPSLDSFDAVFTHCGICHLFKRLDIQDLTPALCAYDFAMAERTGTIFTRKFTLAGGGPHCDCHYQKRTAGSGRRP